LVRFRSWQLRTAVLPIGWLIALTAIVCFSLAPPLVRGAILGGLSPTAILIARMGIATFLLTTFLGLAAPQRLRIDRRNGLIAFGSGLINGIGFITFFLALTRLSASIASMMFSLSPLMVLGLLALRGEPITRRHIVRLVLGIGGVYLLIGPGGEVDLWGVVLVFLTILSFSLHLVCVQWYLPQVHPQTVTFYVNLGVTMVCFFGWLAAGRPWTTPTPAGWLSILALAIICTFLARLLLFESIQRIGSGQIALLTPLETLLTVIWSYLFLDERLTAVQWLGGLLILLSMALARRWRPLPRL
jgi:drug/metabolite transporter (DMT)-like permease